jgi:hypothetical protein
MEDLDQQANDGDWQEKPGVIPAGGFIFFMRLWRFFHHLPLSILNKDHTMKK